MPRIFGNPAYAKELNKQGALRRAKEQKEIAIERRIGYGAHSSEDLRSLANQAEQGATTKQLLASHEKMKARGGGISHPESSVRQTYVVQGASREKGRPDVQFMDRQGTTLGSAPAGSNFQAAQARFKKQRVSQKLKAQLRQEMVQEAPTKRIIKQQKQYLAAVKAQEQQSISSTRTPITMQEWFAKQPEEQTSTHYIMKARKEGMSRADLKQEILYRENTQEKKEAGAYIGYTTTQDIINKQKKVGSYDFNAPLKPRKGEQAGTKEQAQFAKEQGASIKQIAGILGTGGMKAVGAYAASKIAKPIQEYQKAESFASKHVKPILTDSRIAQITNPSRTILTAKIEKPTGLEKQAGMSLPRPTTSQVLVGRDLQKFSMSPEMGGATQWYLEKFREKPITTGIVTPAALYGAGTALGVGATALASTGVVGATAVDVTFKGALIYWGYSSTKKIGEVNKQYKAGELTLTQKRRKIGATLGEEAYYAIPLMGGAVKGGKLGIKWGMTPQESALLKLTLASSKATPHSQALKETPQSKTIYRELGYKFGTPTKTKSGWTTKWHGGSLAWQGLGKAGLGMPTSKSYPLSKLEKLFPTTYKVKAPELKGLKPGKPIRGSTITAKTLRVKPPKYKNVKGYESFMIEGETAGQFKLSGMLAEQIKIKYPNTNAVLQYRALQKATHPEVLKAGSKLKPKAKAFPENIENFPAKTTVRAGEQYFASQKSLFGKPVTYNYGTKWDYIYLSPKRAQKWSIHDIDKMIRLSEFKSAKLVKGALPALQKTGAKAYISEAEPGLIKIKTKSGEVKQLYDTHAMLSYGENVPRGFAGIPYTQKPVKFQGEVGMSGGESTFRRFGSSGSLNIYPGKGGSFSPRIDRGKDIWRGSELINEIADTSGLSKVKSAAEAYTTAFEAPKFQAAAGTPKSIAPSIPIAPKFVGGLKVMLPHDTSFSMKRIVKPAVPSLPTVSDLKIKVPGGFKMRVTSITEVSKPAYFKSMPVISAAPAVIAPSMLLRSRRRSRVSEPSRPSKSPSVSSMISKPSKPSLPSKYSMPSLPSKPSIPSLPSSPSIPSYASVSSSPSIPSVPSLPSLPSSPSVPSIPRVPPLIPGGGFLPAGIGVGWPGRKKPGAVRGRKYTPSVKAFYENIKVKKGSKKKYKEMMGLTGIEVRPLITNKNMKVKF